MVFVFVVSMSTTASCMFCLVFCVRQSSLYVWQFLVLSYARAVGCEYVMRSCRPRRRRAKCPPCRLTRLPKTLSDIRTKSSCCMSLFVGTCGTCCLVAWVHGDETKAQMGNLRLTATALMLQCTSEDTPNLTAHDALFPMYGPI